MVLSFSKFRMSLASASRLTDRGLAPAQASLARVFYLGAPWRVRLPPGADVTEALRHTSGNTGNLLIGSALQRQLKVQCLVSRRELGAEYVTRNFDRVIIGASNFLYENADFKVWADFLERVDLPCTIIGLGAQAPDSTHPVKVPAGTLKLVRLGAERSKTLGVRGDWTASVLAGLGIHNVRVIGCPAMFWNCQPELGFKPAVKGRPLAVALNGAAHAVEHAADVTAARKIERQLVQLALQHGYPYILQNALELARLIENPAAYDPLLLSKAMEQYGLSELAPEAFVRFVQQTMRIYFRVKDWFEAIRQFDFVVGTRFHGCLIALLAGVPGFIFALDARTRELCELLNLPHQPIQQAGGVNVDALYESVDLERVKRRYRELYRNYISFLEENEIEHNLRQRVDS